VELTLTKFSSPEEVEQATREAYRKMTPNERVALTVRLQREFYSRDDLPQQLERVLEVLDTPLM
jgi:hypothetical protein